MEATVTVQQIHKSYGQTVAVQGVSFDVHPGEIFGMVGPNGAGKTTTIECVEGLRRPDSGHIRVLGMDPWRERRSLMARVGIQLQESGLPPRLRVGEAMDLFASFYPRTVPWKPLLEQFGLAEKRRTSFADLSGGQKQRLFIALALLNDPQVVFLDELTTGLDPQARRAMWDLVRDIARRGKTVFLTTHFMEEAERLCDRVAIMDHGRIIALDAPEALIRGMGLGKRVVFTMPNGQLAQAESLLRAFPEVEGVETAGERLIVFGRGTHFASVVVRALEQADLPFQDLRTEQPSLEDVFLTLTGRQMRE